MLSKGLRLRGGGGAALAFVTGLSRGVSLFGFPVPVHAPLRSPSLLPSLCSASQDPEIKRGVTSTHLPRTHRYIFWTLSCSRTNSATCTVGHGSRPEGQRRQAQQAQQQTDCKVRQRWVASPCVCIQCTIGDPHQALAVPGYRATRNTGLRGFLKLEFDRAPCL